VSAKQTTQETMDRMDELKALSDAAKLDAAGGGGDTEKSMTETLFLLHRIQSMMADMQAAKAEAQSGLAASSLAQSRLTIEKMKAQVDAQVQKDEKMIEARVLTTLKPFIAKELERAAEEIQTRTYVKVDALLRRRDSDIVQKVSRGVGLGNFAAVPSDMVEAGAYDGVVTFDTKEGRRRAMPLWSSR
jgi:hypothetical protein